MTKAWRWIRKALIQAACLAVVAVAASLFTLAVVRGPNSPSISDGLSFSYSDFVAVSLTAVTIVLAVIAAIIASIAFWSIKEIKASARKVALRQARSAVASELRNLPQNIKDQVTQQLPSILDEQVKLKLVEMAASGELAVLLERATAGRLSMNPTADIELQDNFDPNDEEGER
ncbi:hypothetical protein E4L95_12030 [Paracoccus liaowanqingii]|uniref:Uncharacterized protein n=1 Tax=Paracoccus liaowanqingii TaxID=2560053 RepID=A0A4Z1BK58_9RHOB|nr:hypothetical protein [Paracoccus liaowanqingii]TGN59058.1 hypothetical protein E4L95_12030 [Paracoccus liaowanqingii]